MKTKLFLIALTVATALCGCDKKDDSAARQIEQLSKQVAQLQSQVTDLQNTLNLFHDEVLDSLVLMHTNIAIICNNQVKAYNVSAASQLSLIGEIDSVKKSADVSTVRDSLTLLDIKIDELKSGQNLTHDKLDQLFDVEMETEKNVSDIAIKTHSF
jgi:hypothetical protein